MLKISLKIFLALIFWSLFIYVIFTVPYPESLPQASSFQLLSFFIPLFLALALTANLLINNIPSSLIFSLGIILLLFLKSLKAINSIAIILIIIAILLVISYFKTPKSIRPTRSGFKNLTSSNFVPKLRNLRRKR